LLIRTGVAASRVTVTTIRQRGDRFRSVYSRRAKRSDAAGRKWAFRLPRSLRRANKVDVFVQWSGEGATPNDADFWAGIRLDR
jgi:hypothetical protein